jgi:hypothetical protein
LSDCRPNLSKELSSAIIPHEVHLYMDRLSEMVFMDAICNQCLS